MPPRAKHNFRKIHLMKKSSQCKVLAHLLTKSHISISASSHIKPEVHHITGSSSADRKSISVSYSTEKINLSSNLSSSLLSASVKVCPKFEIPKPVKLGARSEEKQTIHEKIVQEKACLQPILKIPKVEVFPDDGKHMAENNVPLSVIEVIEDVIRKYSLEHHSELKFKKEKHFCRTKKISIFGHFQKCKITFFAISKITKNPFFPISKMTKKKSIFALQKKFRIAKNCNIWNGNYNFFPRFRS